MWLSPAVGCTLSLARCSAELDGRMALDELTTTISRPRHFLYLIVLAGTAATGCYSLAISQLRREPADQSLRRDRVAFVSTYSVKHFVRRGGLESTQVFISIPLCRATMMDSWADAQGPPRKKMRKGTKSCTECMLLHLSRPAIPC